MSKLKNLRNGFFVSTVLALTIAIFFISFAKVLAKSPGAEAYLNIPSNSTKEVAVEKPPASPPTVNPAPIASPQPAVSQTPAAAPKNKMDLTRKGRNDGAILALTFDDGPKPGFANTLLDVLDKYQVKATFFVVGQQALWHPDLIYRMAASGHELANHSYFHSRFDFLRQKEMAAELRATDEIIKSITGQAPKYFRPPGGRWDDRALTVAKRFGLLSIGWSINAGDYVRSQDKFLSPEQRLERAGQVKEKVLSQLVPGAIILMHNGGDETMAVLPAIIEEAQARGFRFVLLSEILGES